jgi:hypothetical protein
MNVPVDEASFCRQTDLFDVQITHLDRSTLDYSMSVSA